MSKTSSAFSNFQGVFGDPASALSKVTQPKKKPTSALGQQPTPQHQWQLGRMSGMPSGDRAFFDPNFAAGRGGGGGLRQRGTVNPLTISDLAQQGVTDVQNKIAAQREQRELAKQAYLGLEEGYGEAVDQIMDATAQAQQQGRADYEGAMAQGTQRMGEARQFAQDVYGRQKEKADALAQQTEQWREEGFAQLTDRTAQAVNAQRLGMEGNFNDRMANIDSLASQGKIPDPEGAIAELKMEHSRQLGSLVSRLDVEYFNLNTQMRATVDNYSLAIKQASEAAVGTTGANVANIMSQLEQAEAQNASIAAQEQQKRDIERVQLQTVAQQLRARGAESMAELLTSPAFAPVAVEMLPLTKDLYDMYEFEEQQGGLFAVPMNQAINPLALGGMNLGWQQPTRQAGGGASRAPGRARGSAPAGKSRARPETPSQTVPGGQAPAAQKTLLNPFAIT